MMSRCVGVLALVVFSGCGPSRPAPTKEPVQPDAPAAPETPAPEPAAETQTPEPAKPTKEELDKGMAPPAGLVDVRPIFGTDPAEQRPAVFASVKKGMKAEELDKLFPGVGAVKVTYVSFGKQGARWVRVKGTQAHKELLDLEYDDQGGIKKMAYMFDPASARPELWDYLKKSGELKWGKAEGSGDLLTWKVLGVESISLLKTDAKTFSLNVVF